MNGSGNDRIYGIQLVRAILCLGIVIAHSFAYAEYNFEAIGPGAMDFWGRYALLNFTSVFFAISGFFLSASIYRIDNESAEGTLSFLKKKFIRIYPVYWLAVVCAIMLRVIVQGGYTSSGSVFKSFLLLPLPNTPQVLSVEWTLLFEVLFFLVASLFASSKRKKWFPFAMGLWGAVIWIAVLTGKSDFSVQLTMPRILISGQVLYFILGVFLYYIYIYITSRTLSDVKNTWCLFDLCCIRSVCFKL